MASFSISSLHRLCDLVETELRCNQAGVIEGKKSFKIAVAGAATTIRLHVTGSCWIAKEEVTALLLEADLGTLGVVVGATTIRPSQAFFWVVDMAKVKKSETFDSIKTLRELIERCGPAIAKSFIQDDRGQPWRERDLSDILVA